MDLCISTVIHVIDARAHEISGKMAYFTENWLQMRITKQLFKTNNYIKAS